MQKRLLQGIESHSLLFSFLLALLAHFFAPSLLPSLRLLPFLPWIALVAHRCNLPITLYLALGCGLICDLSSFHFYFGLFSVCYLLTALIAYLLRHYFYLDRLPSLHLFVMLLSFTFSLIQLLLIHPAVPYTSQLILQIVLLLPLLDGLYAFCWFSSPLILYSLLEKMGRRNRS